MPPWSLLAACIAACPQLQQLRLRVLPCRTGHIDRKENFNISRYTPFGAVLHVLPQSLEDFIIRFTARWDTGFGGPNMSMWDLHVLDDAFPSPKTPELEEVTIEYELGDWDRPEVVKRVVGETLPRLTASDCVWYERKLEGAGVSLISLSSVNMN